MGRMLLTRTTLDAMARQQGARVGASNEQKLRAAVDALATKRYGSASQENLKKLFLSYDKNKDGAADVSEIEDLMYDANVDGCRSAFLATCARWAKGVVDQVDGNGDSKIDWDEYRVAAGLPKEVAPPPPPPPPPPSADEATTMAAEIAKGISGPSEGMGEQAASGAPTASASEGTPSAPAANLSTTVERSSGPELAVAGAVALGIGLLLFLKK
jgi:hypothetical protein